MSSSVWKPIVLFWSLLLPFLVFFCKPSQACTVFLVGKNATVPDTATLVSHSNDGEFDTDPRLVKAPSRMLQNQRPVYFSPESYPRYVGTEREIKEYHPRVNQTSFKPIGFIPLSLLTNGSSKNEHETVPYLEETYGAVNNHQVAIGESTCSGVFGAIPLGQPNGTALLSIDEMSRIAMEFTTSARQAVQLMGDLAVQYGFYGAGEFEGTAESLAVSDPEEAWLFHVLPDPTGTSAIWVAQRIPDNTFSVLANMFVIREVDPQDTTQFLMSPSVHQVAQDYGWWDPSQGTLLDFTKIYSDGEYAHKYYSGRRMWGAYRLVGQEFPDEYVDLQSDPVYPVYTIPEKPLSAGDLMRFHRDVYAGTKYDLSAVGNLAGGPFGSPDRWKAGPKNEAAVGGNWERPIGLYRTSDTYIVQTTSSPEVSSQLGATLWFGTASALTTIFTPFVVSMDEIPPSFRSGHHAVFSRDTAFWAACTTQNIANLKWSYMIQDIQQMQDKLETASVQLMTSLHQQAQKQKLANGDARAAIRKNANSIVSSLWSLSDELLFKYASGFVNEPELSQMVGYPTWWLEAVGYADGPPPPPTQPKCCNPSPKQDDDDDDDDDDTNLAAMHPSSLRVMSQ